MITSPFISSEKPYEINIRNQIPNLDNNHEIKLKSCDYIKTNNNNNYDSDYHYNEYPNLPLENKYTNDLKNAENNKIPFISNCSKDFFNSKSFDYYKNNTILSQTKNLFEKSNLAKTDSLEIYCNKYQNYLSNRCNEEYANKILNSQEKNEYKKDNTIDIIFQNRVTDQDFNYTNGPKDFLNSFNENSQKIKIEEENKFSLKNEDVENNNNFDKVKPLVRSPKYNFYYNTLDNFSEINKFPSNANTLEYNGNIGKNFNNSNDYYNKETIQEGNEKTNNNYNYPLSNQTISLDPSLIDTNTYNKGDLYYSNNFQNFESIKNKTNNNDYKNASSKNTLNYSDFSKQEFSEKKSLKYRNNNNTNYHYFNNNNDNNNFNNLNINWQNDKVNFKDDYRSKYNNNNTLIEHELLKKLYQLEEEIHNLKFQIINLTQEKEDYFFALQKEKQKNQNYLEEIEHLSQIRSDLNVLTEKYEFLTKEYRYLVDKYQNPEQKRINQEAKLYVNENNSADKIEGKDITKILNTDEDMENIKNGMENPFLNNQRPTSESKTKKKSKSRVIKKDKKNGNEINTSNSIVKSEIGKKTNIAKKEKTSKIKTGKELVNNIKIVSNVMSENSKPKKSNISKAINSINANSKNKVKKNNNKN